jgi:SH3 domain-containing protein
VEEEPDDLPSAAPAPSNPRQVRARRRRRRRLIGTLLFLLVAVAVFAAAYFALTGDDGSSDSSTTTTSAGSGGTTTTAAPAFAGSYKVTTGVNVRQGAGTTFPTVGTIETGRSVLVVCVAQGQPVDTPVGPNPQWLKITGLGPTGYISSLYVTTGDDLKNSKIPACPAA